MKDQQLFQIGRWLAQQDRRTGQETGICSYRHVIGLWIAQQDHRTEQETGICSMRDFIGLWSAKQDHRTEQETGTMVHAHPDISLDYG